MSADGYGPVLVTGCSSGIGRSVVRLLSSQAHSVFAGARKEKDLKELNRLPHVTAVRLDVTSTRDIRRAVELVRRKGEGLYGLVNNAGVNGFGPLLETSVTALQRVYSVNLYGYHRLTRAFAPLLMASKGRVVNIGSVNGFIISRLFGAYNISKHAVEAYSDTLREELAGFGVAVSTIEPGDFQSEIDANHFGRSKAEGLKRSRYAEELAEIVNSVQSSPETLQRNVYSPPAKVAESGAVALFSPDPKPRYLVGSRDEAVEVMDCILETLAQANRSRDSNLSREELVRMLDRHLGQAVPGAPQARRPP